jgi:hypothetical protein
VCLTLLLAVVGLASGSGYSVSVEAGRTGAGVLIVQTVASVVLLAAIAALAIVVRAGQAATANASPSIAT